MDRWRVSTKKTFTFLIVLKNKKKNKVLKLHIWPLYSVLRSSKWSNRISCNKTNSFRIFNITKSRLTHSKPMLHFYTPWKHQKTSGFLMSSRVTEMEHWVAMDHCLIIAWIIACAGKYLFKVINKNTESRHINNVIDVVLVSPMLTLKTINSTFN